ncbi:MAG TPA: DUF2127 domain-containing protein [Aggregatilineaceae bacterium]|nr:DUF2127 domain-containing protein [Aggregatilineaceae bacterium]
MKQQESDSPPLPYGYSPLSIATRDPLHNQSRTRPGCVSAYVVFMAFSVMVALCSGTWFVFLPSYQKTSLAQTYEEQARIHYEYKGKTYVGSENDIMQNVFEDQTGIPLSTLGVIVLVFGLVSALAGLGLWRMRRWGLILSFIALAISLGLTILTINLAEGAANITSRVVWIVVMGGIALWLGKNRWRFV